MRTHQLWDWTSVHQLALRETRRVLGAGPDAEDAAQDAAIRAWRRRATCHDAPGAWIRTIARNEALRIARRRRHETPLETASWEQAAAHAPADVHDLHGAIE